MSNATILQPNSAAEALRQAGLPASGCYAEDRQHDLGPMAVNVHRLEQRAKNLEHLCGEMLATLRLNRERGTLTSRDNETLDALIARWGREHQSA